MKGITVKLPDTTLRQLRQEARGTGRSVAALIRERLEALPRRRARRSVYQITSDLAGSVAGDRTPATNDVADHSTRELSCRSGSVLTRSISLRQPHLSDQCSKPRIGT
jgi:hypothetical protein